MIAMQRLGSTARNSRKGFPFFKQDILT